MPDRDDPTDPGGDMVLEQLADQAVTLRAQGREADAELLLALRRLHARRLRETDDGADAPGRA
jgi:hypothetical protein